jgi:hypothetical protein
VKSGMQPNDISTSSRCTSKRFWPSNPKYQAELFLSVPLMCSLGIPEGLGSHEAGRCRQERAVRGASTKDREVDRLEATVVRTFSGAGCQATHHVHLGPQVDVVARF